MEDETLTNILNLLQGNNVNSKQTNPINTNTSNNDLQTLLIKFLLSGGLTQILNFFSQKNIEKENNTPEKTRTIDLKNYQRID